MSIISKDGAGLVVDMTADALRSEHPHGDWHAMTVDDVLGKLDTHHAGLSNDEVLSRRELYGENKLDEKPPIPSWMRFLEQFKDPMVYLLFLAAVIATIFEPDDIGTPIFIVIALTLNAFLDTFRKHEQKKRWNH